MEQLGYIALGCVLVLAVLVLRRSSIALAIHSVDRMDWSKIRLPKFGRAGVGMDTQNEELGAIEHRGSRCAGVDLCVIHCYEGDRTRRYHGGVGEDSAADAARKNTGSQTCPTSNYTPS